MTEQEMLDPFLDLDWTALEDWAGSRTLSRGRQYQREGRVHELVRSPNEAIVAWVDGAERYATAVYFDNGIRSVCTCPVGSGCKHAVAVILEYLALHKDNRPIRELPADDSRRLLLDDGAESIPGSSQSGTGPDHLRITGSIVKKKTAKPKKSHLSLHHYLSELTKEDLIGLLEDLMSEYPQVRQDVSDRKSVAASDAGPVLEALLSDIDSISCEEAWSNSWTGESRIPDYTPVRKRMEILLEMGHPDAVVEAGSILLKNGTAQIEQSEDDEGETAGEIASCMDLVFLALLRSSRPGHERMLSVIHAELDDEYDLCGGAEKFWEENYPASEWGLVADRLLRELGEHRVKPGKEAFSSKYHRDRLVSWIVTALDHAGRDREATDLCIAEVDLTDNYPRLIRRLIRTGHRDEAVTWIKRGIDATGKSLTGIAAELRTIQRELWEKEGDLIHAAGLRAGEFLDRTSFLTYRQLEKSARAAGAWDSMEGAVRQFLETGKLPAQRRGDRNDTGNIFGSLPDTGLFPRDSIRVPGSPFFDILIDIAIAEKRPDEVIIWYDKLREVSRARGSFYHPDDKVADAVFEQFPDRALGIWREKAERLAKEARPKSYEASVSYLKKIRALMKKQGREDEWEDYLAKMRGLHVRKKRFLEMLMVFEGKKILQS
ncbi:MAG: hypothetical protein LUQ04_02890 [Methanoregula sp.]|nr:hypothetical protein [Methanoregula sp.]